MVKVVRSSDPIKKISNILSFSSKFRSPASTCQEKIILEIVLKILSFNFIMSFFLRISERGGAAWETITRVQRWKLPEGESGVFTVEK